MSQKTIKETRTVNKSEYEDEKEEKKNSNYYFTKETENSIVEYNDLTAKIEKTVINNHDRFSKTYEEYEEDHEDVKNTRDVVEELEEGEFDELVKDLPQELQGKITDWRRRRGMIYKREIQAAFQKLVESIFNKGQFSYFDVPYEDVQQRVIHHLIEKIHMYEKGKGKAFSYFSMIARNKLIQINNKNYDRYKEEVRIDKEESQFDLPLEETFEDRIQRDEFFQEMIDYWRNRMSNMFNKKRDIRIADALLEIFEKRKSIETFNKKGLYVMIREMTGVERTQHITKVVKKFREEYKDLVRNFRNRGTIHSENKFFET